MMTKIHTLTGVNFSSLILKDQFVMLPFGHGPGSWIQQ
jgi:hypothetical protein